MEGQCGTKAYFFMQAPCLVQSKFGSTRQIEGLVVGCIAVFIYLFTLIYFDYIRCVQQNLFIDWDVKTITAGDYTVEFDIPAKVYTKFLESYLQPSNPISEINQFKLYIKHEMETRLNAFPDLGYDGDAVANQQVKVAVVTCAFDNSKIIKWLTQRGTHIKNEKWDKLDAVEKTINDNLRTDKDLIDKLQRPCSVFITMETEEGYYRLENYNDTVQMEAFAP